MNVSGQAFKFKFLLELLLLGKLGVVEVSVDSEDRGSSIVDLKTISGSTGVSVKHVVWSMRKIKFS